MIKSNFNLSVLQDQQHVDVDLMTPKLIKSLWCYVYIENFSLQIMSGDGYRKRPSVLYEYINGETIITQLNSNAIKKGLSISMALSMTHGLSIDSYSRDKMKEQKIKKRFFKDLNNFSPIVINESTDGILVEIGGSIRLFGGREKTLSLIRERFIEYGYSIKTVVAPTPRAASIIAKSGLETNVWDINNLNATISMINLNYLGLQKKDMKKFLDLGVKTLGDVYRLPRVGILERFSPDVLKLIDQLYGRVVDLSESRVVSDFFTKLIEVDLTNNMASFENCIRLVLYDLNIFLKKRTAKTKSLKWFFFSKKSLQKVHVKLNSGTSDPEFLFNETKNKIRGVFFNVIPDKVGLYVDDVRHYLFQTKDLFLSKDKQASKNSGKYINDIIQNYGSNIAYQIFTKPSCVPERTFDIYDSGYGAYKNTSSRKSSFGVEGKKYRPTWLLQNPKRLTAKNGRVEFEGSLKIISERERLVSGWWDGGEVARDYFIAKNDDHRLFWIFKDLKNDKKWYLHGIFD